MIQSFIARQPIVNRRQEIVGYELLYRFNHLNKYQHTDPNEATLQVLKNVFFHTGYEKLSNNKLLFLNFTKELLFSNIFDVLEPKYVVIELLETIQVDLLVIARIKELKRDGFIFALDDVTECTCTNRELIEQVDIAKIDYISTSKSERRHIEQMLKRNSDIILLAEKIETEADYEEALANNHSLLQGFYFEQPEMVFSKVKAKKLV